MLSGKFAALFLVTFIVLAPLASWHPVSASDSNLVILVSDNEADYALARGVATLLGAKLVVAPWGNYNATVSAEVLTAGPDKVIIIGGPVAVVNEYTQDLNDFGIPYERLYGADRYGTNLAVVEYLKMEFPGQLSKIQGVVVVNGHDVLAMQHYLRYYSGVQLGKGWLLVLTGPQHINETLDVFEMVGLPRNLTYIASVGENSLNPMFPIERKQLEEWFSAHFGGIPSVRIDRISPGSMGRTYEVLVDVQNRTRRAERYLDGLNLPDARKNLENARRYISRAWDAYNSGDSTEAYLLAVKAAFMADSVMLEVHRAMDTVFQGSPKLRLSTKLRWMREILDYLKTHGYDVSSLEALLSQAENALNAGQFETVLQELHQIKEKMPSSVRKGHSPWHRNGGGHRGP